MNRFCMELWLYFITSTPKLKLMIMASSLYNRLFFYSHLSTRSTLLSFSFEAYNHMHGTSWHTSKVVLIDNISILYRAQKQPLHLLAFTCIHILASGGCRHHHRWSRRRCHLRRRCHHRREYLKMLNTLWHKYSKAFTIFHNFIYSTRDFAQRLQLVYISGTHKNPSQVAGCEWMCNVTKKKRTEMLICIICAQTNSVIYMWFVAFYAKLNTAKIHAIFGSVATSRTL